jgi:hypothetical protein
MVVNEGDELALLTGHDPPVMMDRAPPAKLEKQPIHHPPLPQGQQMFL